MKRGGERGFSLVEIVIALGLLAGVLIAIAGLFIMGGRSVKSGRTSSEALTLGKEIIEEMNGWGFSQLWGNFGLAGTSAKSYTVDTSSCVTADCTSWQSTLASKLGATAHATIKLDVVSQTGVATPDFVTAGVVTAKNVRITVNVLWTQVAGRNRQVAVVTTRN